MRATSRWLVKRILPCFVKRSRTRRWPSGNTADQGDMYSIAPAQVLPRALTPAGRGHRRRDDVLQPESGAGPAVVARRPAAVLHGHAGQRVLPVPPEEVAVQTRRDVVPRERLVFLAVPVAHLLDAEILRGQGGLPEGQIEALGPLLEGASGPPDPLDHGAHPSVTPAGQSLGHRGRRFVPADRKATGTPGLVAQQGHLALELRHRVLAEPLERRMGFGDEPAHGRHHGHPFVVLPTDFDAACAEPRYPKHVLVELGGQPDEEIELDPPPTLAEGGIDRAVEILLGDQLVDDRPHPPRPAFGGERQTRALDLLNLRRCSHREGIHAERGKADRDPAPVFGVIDDGTHSALYAGEV